jgi:hypothetical protein
MNVFDQFMVDMAEGVHNLETDTIRVALVDSTITPTAATSDPRWGAGGGTNLATNEVTAGGNYTAGGIDISSGATMTLTGGAAVFDSTVNPQWLQDAGNPTDARWAIVYNDTAAGNNAIGWVDLGSVFDMSGGDLTITWNASGLFDIDQA